MRLFVASKDGTFYLKKRAEYKAEEKAVLLYRLFTFLNVILDTCLNRPGARHFAQKDPHF